MIDRSKQETTREKSVFQSIIENISRTANLPASIWVPDERRQVLTIAASVGLPASYTGEAFLDLDEPSVTGEAFKTGKVLRVPDVLADQRWKYKDMACEMGWKSALCVPIQVNKMCIGVVSIYTFVVREFSDLEIGLLTSYADQIQLTLEADRRRETFSRLLEAGHQIEQLITEQPQVVLEEIVKAACQVIGADCAVLYPYDPQREDFYDIDSVAAYGLSKSLQLSQRPRRQTGMAAYVRREREVVISDIEREDPEMLASPFIEREGIKAFMGIALQVAAEVLGILYVDFRVAHPFSDEEKDTIRLFAHQAALAIHNMRSYQQAENRAEALKRLHQIGPALVSIPGVPEGLQAVLTQIVQNAQSVLGADVVDLYQYIQSRDEYVLPAVQIGKRYHPSIRKDSIEKDDVIHGIIESWQPQYFAEVQQEPILTRPFTVERPEVPSARFVIREEIRSTAAVPLIAGTEVVGMLFANYRTPQTFPQQQRELIELFASQAAIAIYNVRLFQDTQLRVRDLEIINDVVQIIGTKLDTRELFRAIVSQIVDKLKCAHCTLFLLQEEKGEPLLVPQETRGADSEKIMTRRFKLGEGLAGWVFLHGQSMALADARTDPRFSSARVEQDQSRSMLVAPIKVGDRTIGVISAEQNSFGWFSESDRRLVDALAWQAGIAIERATGLALLQDISNQIIGAQKVDDVLRQIVSGAIRLTNTKAGVIYLFSEDRESITQSFAYSPTFEHPKPRMSGEGGITRRVIETGKMMVFPDIRKDDRVNRAPTDRGVRSMIAIPLKLRQEVIGVLYLNDMEPRDFTETERALLAMLASQAAVAIYNAELFQRTQERLEQRLNDLRALQNVYEAVGQAPLEEILRLIVGQAVNLTPAQYGNLWLLEQEQQELRFGVEVNLLDTPSQCPDRIPVDEHSINGWVALTGKSRLCPDVTVDEHYQQILTGIRSKLAVPLRRGERAIGTLNVESTGLAAFVEDHRQLLEALASQAAIAIDNARLYDRLNALARVGQAVISTLDLDRVLDIVLEEALRALETSHGTIQLLNRSRGTLEVKAHRGEVGGPTYGQIRLGEGITGWVALHGRPFLARDVQSVAEGGEEMPQYLPYFAGTRCEAAAPIQVDDRTIGVLNVEHPQSYAFDEQDLHLLETIARQAAVAIHNARLYEAMQAVNQVGQALTSGIRRREEEILELVHSQVSRLMNTDNMYIALYDQTTDVVRFGLAAVDGVRVDVEKEKGWQPRKAGQGKTEEIIRTRKPLFHPTKVEAKAWYAQPEHKEYVVYATGSWLGVPMIVGERVLGVIATYHPMQDHVYSGDDLEILQTMADQAAIALDNARMFYDVNQRLDALVDFGQVITSGIHLREEDILELIHGQASRLMDTDNMYIALYDETTDIVRFGLGFVGGVRVDVEREEGWQPRKAGQGKTEEIIRTRKPLFHPAKAEAEAWYARPEHKEYVVYATGSWLGVPMMVGEKVLGVIATYHLTQDYVYSGEDLLILQGMANQAAVALENARLYQEAAKLYREARSEAVAARQLATLGTAMAALQHRINNTFNIIVPNVMRLRKRVDMTDGTTAEILDIIERNARYTSDVIKRIQEPLGVMERQSVDVNAVLADVVSKAQELKADSTRPFVQVELILDDSIPYIQAPIGQIAEVFRNLVDNAYRAMRVMGGYLTVQSERVGDSIQVRVQDTGYGIPPEVQKRLFVKPVPSKDLGRGAGLGLWLSRLMLQSIGGDVTMEKTGDDGTTMLVQIPLLEEKDR
jgi:GAF domain-containing protein